MNIKSEKVVFADMHTHSENSHDSACKIEDMYIAQRRAGTDIFAVTDHFDTASYTDYDVFSPIIEAHETVEMLKKKYSDSNILSGIEISEGFWYPEVCKKVLSLVDYDVVIGSVHLVRYENMMGAYSKIDFSALNYDVVVKYIKAYFADMLTMLDRVDFDVLAHLTCPFRYINGKYKRGVDELLFISEIEEILRQIIKKEIALEINTSSFNMLNDSMPPIKILQMYRELGGRLITLGSDAHIAENASVSFSVAVEKIKKTGFEHIYFYKNRTPHEISV